MTVALMRNIDRYVGVPLCWLYGTIRRFSRRKNALEVNSILVVKFFGMGSIVLSSPALALLRSSYPGARIDVLTFYSNRDLVERYAMVDNVLTIRTSAIGEFMRDTLNIIMYLRKANYDLVFDFEFFSKFSTLLGSITRASMHVGFALPTRWRSMLLTHQVPLKKDMHVTNAFCEQVFAVTGGGEIPPVVPPGVYTTDIASMTKKLPLNGKPIIAINANVSDIFLERRWMPERFAEVVTKLSEDHDCLFFFIGLESDRDYVQHVIDMTSCPRRCYNISGVLTVPELAAFLQRCEMLLSSDSGPAHLAAALGIRVIGLYGPESPAFYGAPSDTTTMIYKAIPCSPCMNVYAAKSYRCPFHARCMHEIQPEEVLQRIKEVLITT